MSRHFGAQSGSLLLITIAIAGCIVMQFHMAGKNHTLGQQAHPMQSIKAEFVRKQSSTSVNQNSAARPPSIAIESDQNDKENQMTPKESLLKETEPPKKEEGKTSKSIPVFDKPPQYYMVFSTSCHPQQHWESLVFFYHAMKVNQPGNVTRIMSGCTSEESKRQRDFFAKYIQPMSDNFHLHITPDYSTVRKMHGLHSFKYMNKPYGLRHWFEHSDLRLSPESRISDELAHNSIVMLLDPDMILLRPLMHDLTNEEVLWVDSNPVTKVVRTGFPIGQQDGASNRTRSSCLSACIKASLSFLSTGYLTSKWMGLNFSYITGLPDGQFVPPPHFSEGAKHWNSGPPYMATVYGKSHFSQNNLLLK